MTEAYEDYEDGHNAHIAGTPSHENPWSGMIDGHDMLPDEYFEWCKGWWAAEQQFGGSDGWITA